MAVLFLQGVRIYSIQCGATGCYRNDEATRFWKGMATMTGGHHLLLEQFTTVIDFILAICYREHGMEHLQVKQECIPVGCAPSCKNCKNITLLQLLLQTFNKGICE